VIARRVPMTSMPQLVAAFHSLVGMAAVLVAAACVLCARGVRHRHIGNDPRQSLVEMSLGVAIGAFTFTGSVIAFLKLDGRMSGASRSCCRSATSSTSCSRSRWCAASRSRAGGQRVRLLADRDPRWRSACC
jgi:NAD/NADP transhydrogenase beta subunit